MKELQKFGFNSLIFVILFISLNLISITFQVEKSITPWYLPASLFVIFPFFLGMIYLVTIFLTILVVSTVIFEFSLFTGIIFSISITIGYGLFSILLRRCFIFQIEDNQFEYKILFSELLKFLPILVLIPFILGTINVYLLPEPDNSVIPVVRVILYGLGDFLGLLTVGPIFTALMITYSESKIINKTQRFDFEQFFKYSIERINLAFNRNLAYYLILVSSLLFSLFMISIAEYYGLNLFFLIAVPLLINSMAKSERQYLLQLGLTNFAIFVMLVFNQFNLSGSEFIEFQVEISVSILFSFALWQYSTNLAEEQRQKNIIESKLTQAQRFEAIGRLAGGVAHDFNNLMQIINTQVELMELEIQEKEFEIYPESLELIKKSISKGKLLIDQILSFGNLSELDLQLTDLGNYVLELQGFLEELLRNDQNLKLKLSPVPEISIDRVRIEQLITNLITNARDASPDDGEISLIVDFTRLEQELSGILKLIPKGEYVILRIKDNGTGIPNDLKNIIFDPFFSTKPIGEGTGLGLAIVLGIVTNHDAYLSLTSNENSTEFTIYFPLVSEKIIENNLIESLNSEINRVKIRNNILNEKIILVDDNIDLLNTISRFFELIDLDFTGYNDPVECYNDINHIENDAIILITDVVMPNLNGLALAKKFKSKFKNVKVIFMTGYSNNILKTDIDFKFKVIEKPFSLQELSKIIIG